MHIFSLTRKGRKKRERRRWQASGAPFGDETPCFFLKVQVGPFWALIFHFWATSRSQSNYSDIKAHITLTGPFTRKSKAHMPSSPTTAVEPGDDDFLYPPVAFPLYSIYILVFRHTERETIKKKKNVVD